MKKIVLPFILLSFIMTLCLYAQVDMVPFGKNNKVQEAEIMSNYSDKERNERQPKVKQDVRDARMVTKKKRNSILPKSDPSSGMRPSVKSSKINLDREYNTPPTSKSEKIRISIELKLEYLRSLPASPKNQSDILKLENYLKSN